jgi:serine/threonine-protein kinase RsbT
MAMARNGEVNTKFENRRLWSNRELQAQHLQGGLGFRVSIKSDHDIIRARQKGRELAAEIGFSSTDSTLIATSISELSRNIILYAKRGEIDIRTLTEGERTGILVIATDNGPGIPDIRLALQDGYSTSHSLGLGLPGVKRLMDDFQIVSNGRGTTVTVKKWKRQ